MSSDEVPDRGSDAVWRRHLRAVAKPEDVELQLRLLERLIDEFGVVPRPPVSGTRPYLNLYPPPALGRARIGNLAVSSSRFYAMPDPARLELHLRAVPGAEPAEGKYLTRYIHAEPDIAVAASMLRCAFDDRADGPGQPTRDRPRQPGPVRSPSSEDARSDQVERQVVPAEHLAAARRLVASQLYQLQVRGLPQGAPEDERVASTLGLLLSCGGRATFRHVALVTGMPERRVQGYLARLATLLQVDGAAPLVVDNDAGEARLDAVMAFSLFGG